MLHSKRDNSPTDFPLSRLFSPRFFRATARKRIFVNNSIVFSFQIESSWQPGFLRPLTTLGFSPSEK